MLMPRPAEGLVQAHASPTATIPVTTGRSSTTTGGTCQHSGHHLHVAEGFAPVEPVRLEGTGPHDPLHHGCVPQAPQCLVGRRPEDRHRPGVVVAEQREERDRPHRARGPGRTARVPRGRGSSACSTRSPSPRTRRGARHRRARQPTRPASSVGPSHRPRGRSATGRRRRAPPRARAAPRRRPPRRRTPGCARPRHTSMPGWSRAARAYTASATGRRALTQRSRSSPGRGARSSIVGGIAESGSIQRPPASSRRSVSPGSSSSTICRTRANRLCGWWNWRPRCAPTHPTRSTGRRAPVTRRPRGR